MADYTVHLTALPNGRTTEKLSLSALLTPALDESETLPDPFKAWPDWSKHLYDGSASWTLNVQTSPAAAKISLPLKLISTPPKVQYWTALLASDVTVRKRLIAEDHQDVWLLSHPAADLHDRHTTHRNYDTLYRYARWNPSAKADPRTALFLADVQSSIRQTSPHNIFLHPVFDPNSADDAVSMDKLLADANTASAYAGSVQDQFFNADAEKKLGKQVTTRFLQGKKYLEDEAKSELTGIAIFALLRHCAESLLSGQQLDNPAACNDPLCRLIEEINAQAQQCITYDGFTVTDTTFSDVLSYVEFHLFTKRPMTDLPNCKPPDFHQMLGLLHQYPALMRLLGLAYDFEADLISPLLPAATKALINAPGQLLASLDISPKIPSITFDPLYTLTDAVVFVPISLDNSHVSRCLDISGDDFSIVTEDVDGTSHKLTQQTSSRAKGKEYSTTAPMSLKVLDGRDHTNGRNTTNAAAASNTVQSLPSMRTAGVALFHQDRVTAVKNSVARATDTLGQLNNPLYAEDLTLGYRIDIRTIDSHGVPSSWLSLHNRTSVYNFVDENDKSLYTPWSPRSDEELAHDEGFLSLAVTQTTLPATTNADEVKQMQVHPSLVTWTGWSLSAPDPHIPPPDSHSHPPAPHCDPPDPRKNKHPLRLKPIYTVAECSLPKLRFDVKYEMRLRQTDLVGNSLSSTAHTPPAVSRVMDNPFSRHEPIRAPQILLEKIIDRKGSPSEHIDRLVLRDKGPLTTRLLVPPREPLHLAELHGFVDCGKLPPSAFPKQYLLPNGSFPKVSDIRKTPEGENSAEDNDAIFQPRGDSPLPEHPFYPDPLACLSRIETYRLQPDLRSYAPAGEGQITSRPADKPYSAFYLRFLMNGADWPNASPVRIRLESAKYNEALEIKRDSIPLNQESVHLPAIDALIVKLPEGQTVLLQVTSAAVMASTTNSAVLPTGDITDESRAYLVSPSDAESQIADPLQDIPNGHRMSLAYSIGGLQAKAALVQRVTRVNVGPSNPPPPPPPAEIVISPVTPATGEVAPAHQNQLAPPNQTLTQTSAPQATISQLTTHESPAYAVWRNQLVQDLIDHSERLVDGSAYAVTPPHQITLVHAVKQPCLAPEFVPTNSKDLVVMRDLGLSAANVSGVLSAHWLSTSTISATASWTDRVDDLTKAGPENRTTSEIAFEYLNTGIDTNDHRNISPDNLHPTQHSFRDTRARKVKYHLAAFTRFREYFPEGPSKPTTEQQEKEKAEFSRDGGSVELQVDSSVRPPAPSIAYIIPAFAWKETLEKGKWHRGRTMVMRVYLNRPFLVSGDEEKIGLVFAPAGADAANTLPVSRWGGDPIVKSDGGIADNHMTRSDFDGGTLTQGCTAYDGSKVDILSFDVSYAPERRLWYCDIPLSPSKTASAFVRLAIVRWQEHSLWPSPDTPDIKDDARSSQIVFADFMQIRSDRWVSIERIDPNKICVAVSGVFGTPQGQGIGVQTSVQCTIEHRWHRLGKDLGWRPCNDADGQPIVKFSQQPAQNGGMVSGWSTPVKLPHSTSLFKFRLLLEELEWIDADKVRSQPSERKNRILQPRSTYLHYIDL